MFSLIVDNVGSSSEDLYEASDAYPSSPGKICTSWLRTDLKSLKSVASRALLPSFLGGGKRAFEVYSNSTKKQTLERLSQLLGEGLLKPPIDQVFEFEEVPAAFERLRG